MIAGTTPSAIGVEKGQRPLIQNLGPSAVYISRSQTDVVTSGIKLTAGDSFEAPTALSDGGGTLYAQTVTGTADLRVLVVG